MAIEISDKVDLLEYPRVPALKFNARLRGGYASHLGLFYTQFDGMDYRKKNFCNGSSWGG